MHINKLTQNTEIKTALQVAAQGRFYTWKRSYVLQVDHEIYAVALNLFERIGKAILEFFGGDYFQRIFKNKTISFIFKLPTLTDPQILKVVQSTPKFSNYAFACEPTTTLTSLSHRPSNLFFATLLGENKTTMPGSKNLFSFIDGNQKVRETILNLKDDEVIEFNAERKVNVYSRKTKKSKSNFGGYTINIALVGERNLNTYLGTDTFRISGKELKAHLQSQKVHLSPLLPKKFYLALKDALQKEQIIELPGDEEKMYTLERLAKEYPQANHLFQKVKADPAKFDLTSDSFTSLMELTLYQLGSMVVKTENYYSFVGEGLKLRERLPNTNDSIMLISACGIRSFHSNETKNVKGNKDHARDREIMKQTFKCALDAAKEGFALFPAVGMGVWAGDPGIYWRAFFDAIIASDNTLEYIFVNPGHRSTPYGSYQGSNGNEFNEILAEYGDNPKLAKIVNLFTQSTDLLLLAQNLKDQFPQKNVALFNASDPDVTLGNHVGEYVNNLCHANTTEENYAAAGSSCLGFEEITGVLLDDKRVIQH